MQRLWVDFNTADWDHDGRVWIETVQSSEQAPCLPIGMRVIMWDTDLEVEGTIEIDGREGILEVLARPDWPTMRDLPLPSHLTAERPATHTTLSRHTLD